MNIQEATKLAMEKGTSIYRSSEFDRYGKPGSTVEFLPTNSHGYILIVPREKAFTPMWNPMAEDLLADDWKVVGMRD